MALIDLLKPGITIGGKRMTPTTVIAADRNKREVGAKSEGTPTEMAADVGAAVKGLIEFVGQTDAAKASALKTELRRVMKVALK